MIGDFFLKSLWFLYRKFIVIEIDVIYFKVWKKLILYVFSYNIGNVYVYYCGNICRYCVGMLVNCF